MEELIELIDRASTAAGSDTKLAKLIAQPPQRVSDWRHGRVTCPPEDQALMAAVAGLDPVQTLARATVAKHEGKAKGDLLLKALGKASLATIAGLGSAGANATAIFSSLSSGPGPLMAFIVGCSTMYRKVKSLLVLREPADGGFSFYHS